MTTNVEKKELAQERVYYDQSDMQGEMMRYRANSSSYKYGMLAIVFSVLAAFISLNSIKWTTFDVIIKILGNIVILLFGFLSIEKVKAYNKSYSYVLMAFGGICVGRIFWFPLMLITDYTAYLANNLETGRLGATVIGDPMANSYLPQSGYIRAIIAIVFLALSAFFFIVSGIIAYKKSVRYHQYMQGKDISKGV
jgi:hypothetical protein